MERQADPGATRSGVLFALAAYGIWGIAPAYWKALTSVSAPELLAHRVLWSLLVGAAGLWLVRGRSELVGLLTSRRHAAPMAASALLIGINWLVFIYAVETDRVLATSLGYYINPLISVALGAGVLRERLRRGQLLAVAVAAVGVIQLVAASGELPWISLVLATSFALYGLVRKMAVAAPLVGFSVELMVLAPAAAAYLIFLFQRGEQHVPAVAWQLNALVVISGLFTAAPLLCFTSAARRLRLATLGMFQYIAPSMAFVLAVGVYDEPFTRAHAFTFACVWIALAIYSADAFAGRSSLNAAGTGVDGRAGLSEDGRTPASEDPP